MGKVVRTMNMNERIIAVSGGFDPIHVGHVRMFQDAARLGTRLVVKVNRDKFLMAKKGSVFMPLAERMEIVRAMKCVNMVVESIDSDNTVCETLRFINPHVFANGGDRKDTSSIPEAAVCYELGISMEFNIGGGKVQSSSVLVAESTC